ncbi:MAG: CotH kinase family protein [Magnetococcales bacterium]|nr:CotH kinase family protein [Magnetococcales bacterium]
MPQKSIEETPGNTPEPPLQPKPTGAAAPGQSTPSPPRLFSDTLLRRLTLLNTGILLLGLLGVLSVGAIYRNNIIDQLQSFMAYESANSESLDLLRALSPGTSKRIIHPLFELAIKPIHLRDMELHTKSLVAGRVLLDKDKRWYPARFMHQGESFNVKVRVRGDLNNHWDKPKKSLRIKFKRNHYFQGMRQFNLVIPDDKQFEQEQVVYEQARKLGLMVPESGFAKVKINQVDLGLYFWFEQPGKEMIERGGYPQGEIIRSSDTHMDTKYLGFGVFQGWPTHPSAYRHVIHRQTPKAGMIESRFRELLALDREADEATFQRRIPHLLDLDKFVRWNALIWLFGGSHAQTYGNLRWFYDPTRGLFEPIPYDVNIRDLKQSGRQTSAFDVVETLENENQGMLVRRTLRNPETSWQRNRILYDLIVQDGEKILARMASLYQEIREGLTVGIGRFKFSYLDERHQERIQTIRSNLALLKSWLEYGRVFLEPEWTQTGKQGTLKIALFPDSLAKLGLDRLTLTSATPSPKGWPQPERIVLVDPHGMEQIVQPSVIRSTKKNLVIQFSQLDLSTHRDEKLLPQLTQWQLRLTFDDLTTPLGQPLIVQAGLSNRLSNQPILPHRIRQTPVATPSPPSPHLDPSRSPEAFLANTPLPFHHDGHNWILEAGEYTLTKTLVLPDRYGLHLKPGVTIKMGPNVSLVSYRAVEMAGTAAKPIRILPLDPHKPWGVFGVVNATATSHITHLDISGGSEAWINGIFFSGELDFYASPVHLNQITVRDARADDGLNVKKSQIEILHSRFVDNAMDGFDGDWVTGVVADSLFKNNGGDGLDLSGSKILVRDSLFTHMGDKAISAGEKSELVSLNNRLEHSKMGLAAKDLSHVRLLGGVVQENHLGIGLYQKKPIFGGGRAQVLGSLFKNNQTDQQLDQVSTLTLTGVGLEKPPPSHPGLTSEKIHIGHLKQLYPLDAQGNPLLDRNHPQALAFTRGPKIPTEKFLEHPLPDLSNHPVGLLTPLTHPSDGSPKLSTPTSQR